LTNASTTLADASATLADANNILTFTSNYWNNFLIILLSIILSVFTVIALSRKTGAQQLITIQDIWGGVLIGFLVGYFGNVVFDKLIGMPVIT
jgi:hypothetical protein